MDTLERLPAEIVSVRSLGPNVLGYRVRCASPDFSWLAGQHVELSHPHTEARAAYSIASAEDPEAPGEFELAASTRTSSFLLQAQPGTRLWVSAAQGTFVRTPQVGSALFIAVGTGIAPIRALLQAEFQSVESAAEADNQVLLFGCRRAPEILFREEFETLARLQPRFRFVPTLTEPEVGWTGARGRVQAHLSRVANAQPRAQCFVCGTPEMVSSVALELGSLGFDTARIHCQGY